MGVLTGLVAGTECLAVALSLSSCVPLLSDLVTICGPTAYVHSRKQSDAQGDLVREPRCLHLAASALVDCTRKFVM